MRNEMKRKYEPIVNELQSEIPKNMKEKNIPGLAIALISKKGTIWEEGFGYTDMSRQQAVNTDTLFSLQSTTKTVTTVAFLLAVQDGLVELDALLVDYYPEFTVYSRYGTDQYKKITFRHLLSHTSGLTREARVGGVFNYVPCTFKEHIQSISGSWLKFPVGKGFSYSNAGMDVVAYALEGITGMSYPEYVQKRLGDLLGITFYYNTKGVYNKKNAAKGHLGDAKAAPVDPVGLGCGAAHLSIADQAVFVRFLLNLGTVDGTSLLDAMYIDAMRSVDKEGWYGLGTFVNKEYGTSISYHPGGGFGLCSEMYWVPEYDTGVAIFFNQEQPEAYNYISVLAKKAVKRMLGAQGVSTDKTDFPFVNTPSKKVDAAVLERLTGVYYGVWGSAKVTLDKGLHLEYSGKKVALTPHSETAFSAESPHGVLFQVDDNCPVSLKMYSTGGILHMDYWGRPPSADGPKKDEWTEFTGLYHMNIYGTLPCFCAVKIEDDGYLHLKWEASERLYPHESIPTLFFMFHGDTVVFEEDHLHYDNVYWKKIDNPVVFLTELLRSPEHSSKKWIIDETAENLTYLGRNEEKEKVLQLK